MSARRVVCTRFDKCPSPGCSHILPHDEEKSCSMPCVFCGYPRCVNYMFKQDEAEGRSAGCPQGRNTEP